MPRDDPLSLSPFPSSGTPSLVVPQSRKSGTETGRKTVKVSRPPSVMVLGAGAFAYSTAQILKEDGAQVSTYLTRNYGHYPPSLAGPTFLREQYPSPCPLLKQREVDLVIPM